MLSSRVWKSIKSYFSSIWKFLCQAELSCHSLKLFLRRGIFTNIVSKIHPITWPNHSQRLRPKAAAKMLLLQTTQVKTKIHQLQVNQTQMYWVKQNYKRHQVRQTQICGLQSNDLWHPMVEDASKVVATLCLIHRATNISLRATVYTSKLYLRVHVGQIKETDTLKWCKLLSVLICQIGGHNTSKQKNKYLTSNNTRISHFPSKIVQTKKVLIPRNLSRKLLQIHRWLKNWMTLSLNRIQELDLDLKFISLQLDKNSIQITKTCKKLIFIKDVILHIRSFDFLIISSMRCHLKIKKNKGDLRKL